MKLDGEIGLSMHIPIAVSICPTYENFIAECPWCHKENIYNRVSDLQTCEPIAGLDVFCLHDDCKKIFRILNDVINNPHEMLIYDCYELMSKKRYMSCILNLAQSYEVFFNLYFRVELIYRPFNIEDGLSRANDASKKLRDKLERYPFRPMRSLFLQHLIKRNAPKSLGEALMIIESMPHNPEDPDEQSIISFHDKKLSNLLMRLKKSSINKKRDDVVHKFAYRPSLAEVQSAFEETRSIIFPLTSHLRLQDDISFYMRDKNDRIIVA